MFIDQAVRLIILSTIAFVVALIVTPLWYKFLEGRSFRKQIRPEEATPVFNNLHVKKAGTPTGGGIIIWSTVVGLALFFWAGSWIFDGEWKYFNFINRAETYLPLAALLLSALV